MSKQKKKCEPGKHIFSGVDWAKKARPSGAKFICKKCQEEVPFTELSWGHLNREMEKARAFLASEVNNLIAQTKKESK